MMLAELLISGLPGDIHAMLVLILHSLVRKLQEPVQDLYYISRLGH